MTTRSTGWQFSCMTKVRLLTANISANAVCTTTQRSICLKGQQPNCEGQLKRLTRTELPKYRENKLAFINFYKQMKAPYIPRLQLFAAKDPRLRAAKRRKLHSKNRDALVMRVRLQNRQKRRKLLGPAQYRGEDAIYVLLANILEEERRMHAYMGTKKPPVMTPEELQKHKTQPAATSARRASSRTWFWTIFLCTTPILADIAAKATEDVFSNPSEQLEARYRKEQEKPRKKTK